MTIFLKAFWLAAGTTITCLTVCISLENAAAKSGIERSVNPAVATIPANTVEGM
ncbi:MAG: hypothetical protein AAF821_14110 [Cyanobacteria bacterium P01_D01_bin.156]